MQQIHALRHRQNNCSSCLKTAASLSLDLVVGLTIYKITLLLSPLGWDTQLQLWTAALKSLYGCQWALAFPLIETSQTCPCLTYSKLWLHIVVDMVSLPFHVTMLQCCSQLCMGECEVWKHHFRQISTPESCQTSHTFVQSFLCLKAYTWSDLSNNSTAGCAVCEKRHCDCHLGYNLPVLVTAYCHSHTSCLNAPLAGWLPQAK